MCSGTELWKNVGIMSEFNFFELLTSNRLDVIYIQVYFYLHYNY